VTSKSESGVRARSMVVCGGMVVVGYMYMSFRLEKDTVLTLIPRSGVLFHGTALPFVWELGPSWMFPIEPAVRTRVLSFFVS